LSATASAWQKGINVNNHFNGNDNGNTNTNSHFKSNVNVKSNTDMLLPLARGRLGWGWVSVALNAVMTPSKAIWVLFL
jgi:hypothetical protein